MKSHLIIKSTKDMTPEEWLGYRKRGLGASDIGTVLGLNEYKSSAELFYEKVNPQVEMKIESIAAFMGKEQEDFVANLWQHWEGSQESVIANFRAKKIIRRCQRVRAYIHNPKYTHLFVSLDRKINKNAEGKEGALEIKTIAGHVSQKWESGVPPQYIMQMITQIMVCEFDYGELAIFKDGRYLDVLPFEFMANIADTIIERTTEFWNKVERGRQLVNMMYEGRRSFNHKMVHDAEAEMQAIEPEPDGSEAYERFMKEKYRKTIAEIGLIAGTDEDYELGKKYLDVSERMKQLENEQRFYKSQLMRRIANQRKIDFGKRGYISWAGEPRRFKVAIK